MHPGDQHIFDTQTRRNARNLAKTQIIKAMRAGVSAGSFHDLINSIDEMLKKEQDAQTS